MTSVFRYELKIRKKAKKSLKSQHDFLIENWERLYNNVFAWYFSRYKTLNGIEKWFSSLEDFFKQMGMYEMIHQIFDDVKKVVQIGHKTNYRLHKEEMKNFGISFDLNNPAVNQYMRDFQTLQLSDRDGSISLTTKNQVIAVLREWVEQNLSYTEVAKNIQALDQSTFSLKRAKLIAVNETAKAYEYGNYIPMREVAAQGAKVEKSRSTVKDARVSRQCQWDAAVWWIWINEQFPSGNDAPPGHVSCRCTALRRIE